MDRLVRRVRRMQQHPVGQVRRKEVRPKSGTPPKAFDVDNVYAEMTVRTKNREIEYRGPYSPLYSAIYPVVCVTRVFGLAPYDFVADRMTTSVSYLLFSLVFLVVYSYIMYIVFLRFISLKREKSILSVVETTKVIVNYLVVMYELISTMFGCKAFVKIWNTLQDFDEKLRQLGYPRKEGTVEVATWALLFSQAVVWTMVNQSGMYAFKETWMFNVSYMLTYVGTAVSVYKFFGIVTFFGQRFHQLNRITRENLPARVGYKSTILSRKTIQELHNELMLVAETLGSLYSLSLLFWLFNLSVHSVSNLYFIFDWIIFASLKSIAWPLILNMSLWLVGFAMQLLALHIACDYTATEANSMGALLLEWDTRTMTRFPDDDTVRTSLRFLIRRLQFSAGGLFDVNLLLLRSIIAVMSTYLIILLQFPA
ncbi:uncharacterized protein LOC117220945 [Megalopta genalis]|uniref:uncharacterized protein LOC117220945 n=1 Tax=Megalopta genalis TaxID=115081 RepID=UPI003FD4887C